MAATSLFWLIVMFWLKFIVCSKDCPKKCDCFGNIADCSGIQFFEVPPIPTWVESLDLSRNPGMIIFNNSLSELPKLRSLILEDLNILNLPDLGRLSILRKLSLSQNKLEKMSSSWLENMPSLHEIDLSGNQFTIFDPSQFQHVTLRKIYLRKNGLKTVTASTDFNLPSVTELRLNRNNLADEAFRNLSQLLIYMPNLQVVDLNRNALKQLNQLMFKNLSNSPLKTLRLRRNNIQQLSDGMFYGLRSLTTLQLDNNGNITEISKRWLFGLESLETLTLSYNNIAVIEDDAWEATKVITKLDISYNQLGCNSKEPTFKGLDNLHELYIAHNCLKILDSNTFASFSKLKILDISHNKLQWSVEDNRGIFKHLRSLTSLNIAFNQIEKLHYNVFNPLISLEQLILSGNDLKMMPNNPFKNLNNLSKLKLNTTSLVCCQLDWFPNWLATQSFNGIKADCGYPKNLKGASVFNLRPSDFNCEIFPQPEIRTSPQDQTLLYGQNKILECVAFTSGDSPEFIWSKNDVIEAPFLVKDFMSVMEEGKNGKFIYKMTSQLTIENVTHNHAGVYQCIARNSYGPSYSARFKVAVYRFPYFTKKPTSIEATEGSVAKFTCAASGDPGPEMSMQREGEKHIAALERRLFHDVDTWFIKPVLSKDDGNYFCIAKNEAGVANVSARLSVLLPPNFSRDVQPNQMATIGQSIVLDCQGTGKPKPKATWHKGGNKVLENEKRVLLDEGQFLVLLDVKEEDSGAYLCELTNTLGTLRKKIVLAIEQNKFLPTTGIVVITVAITIVCTSIIWVLIIYKAWKRTQSNSYPENDNRRALDHMYSSNLSVSNLNEHHKTDELRTLTPLLSTNGDGYTTQTGQDSGSEHSSGKDSGVVESIHRSHEDLHRNGDVKPAGGRSVLIYPNPSSTLKRKSQIKEPTPVEITDETKPKLSSFGMQQGQQYLDPTHGNSTGPIYASLRRGSSTSSSKLMPVPTPVIHSASMVGSLPRTAKRSYSNSPLRSSYTTLPRCISPQDSSKDEIPKSLWKENSDTSSPTDLSELYNHYSNIYCTYEEPNKKSKSKNSLKRTHSNPRHASQR